MKQALCIVNRKCRRGGIDLSAACARLRDRDIAAVVMRPELHHINTLIREHCPDAAMIIIAGGDGTLNRAAEDLRERGLPLGILPLGTANDLARTLEIPRRIDSACDVIAEGHTRCIDLGWVNGKLFFNVASLGISSTVVRKLTPGFKRKFGTISYLIGLLRALRENRPFRAVIVCDHEWVKVHSIQVSIGNGRYHGGGMAVDAGASIDSHRLDVYSLRPLNFWQFLRMAPAIYEGKHDRETGRVKFMQCREIEIHTSRSLSINTDGETITRTPARLRVIPAAMTVLAPIPGQAPL